MPRPRQCSCLTYSWITLSLTAQSRITRNELTSPFLRLPPEVRNKIYSELLGDRLIHLRYLYDDDLSYETNDSLHAAMTRVNGESRGSAWRHLVCQTDCPEDKEDEKLISYHFVRDGEVIWIRAHQRCNSGLDYYYDPDFMYYDHETIPLRILRTCRQMYTEANQILWSTNTFSFSDPATFKHFVGTRSLMQKRTLKKLRLEMDWDMAEHRDWNSVLNIAVVRSLQGLRQLRLQIDYALESKGFEYQKSTFSNSSPYCLTHVICLKKVAILLLTHVEIVVKTSAYAESNDRYEKLWSKAERAEYAECLRTLLLDPKLKSTHKTRWK